MPSPTWLPIVVAHHIFLMLVAFCNFLTASLLLCRAQIRTGDVVKVRSGEFFPADLVLLSSSEAQGIAYIETASLDGETNLKIRQSLEETNEALGGKEGDAQKVDSAVRGWIVTSEQPNKRLYNFDAALNTGSETLSLAPKQLLLRGAQLRNTSWAIGTVVFAGKDTKLVRNSAKVPLKRSNVERQVCAFYNILLF